MPCKRFTNLNSPSVLTPNLSPLKLHNVFCQRGPLLQINTVRQLWSEKDNMLFSSQRKKLLTDRPDITHQRVL